MRYLIVLVALLTTLTGMAQTGVSGGVTMIKGFGVPKPYPGMHLGIEIPRDDQISYFGRITGTFSNTGDERGQATVEARDPNTTFPNVMNVGYDYKMNYINIEGGTRYYLGNGYDYGWAAYGGSMFMLSINNIKANYDDYDETLYKLQEGFFEKGRIIALNIGLNAGVKNHFSFGMLYFDMSLAYSLFALPSNALASQTGSTMFSPLVFSFNLGFRKDLY